MSDAQTDLRDATANLVRAMNRAEREGLDPRVELDWDNGCTVFLKLTRVWKARITMRGIEVTL